MLTVREFLKRSSLWVLAVLGALCLALMIYSRMQRRAGELRPADHYKSISASDDTQNRKVASEERKSTKSKKAAVKRHVRHAINEKLAPAVERRAEKPEIEVDDDGLSPAERALKDAIEKALDDEDIVAARTLAAQAMIASNTEIREAMVNTLGWFGVKALPELTPFLADPDEDVRDSAMNEWSVAVSEIEDEAEKLGVVELAMHVLTNEDALEDISGEYIGTDEKLAVESLLRVIEAGGSENGIAKAKETYEFVTGEEFVDRAAAEKWLAEEYEPPEKE